MAISITVLSEKGHVYPVISGDWRTKEEAQKLFGSDAVVLLVEEYIDDEEGPNTPILEAMASSISEDHCIGRDLERLIQFAFDLGCKIER